MPRDDEITEHLNRIEEGTRLLQKRASRLAKLLDGLDPYDNSRAASYVRSVMHHQAEIMDYLASARVSFTMGEDLRPMSSWERKRRDVERVPSKDVGQRDTANSEVQPPLF
jgi:hypothetical protein